MCMHFIRAGFRPARSFALNRPDMSRLCHVPVEGLPVGAESDDADVLQARFRGGQLQDIHLRRSWPVT